MKISVPEEICSKISNFVDKTTESNWGYILVSLNSALSFNVTTMAHTIQASSNIHVINFICGVNDTNIDTAKEQYNMLQRLLPAGIVIAGAFLVEEAVTDTNVLTAQLHKQIQAIVGPSGLPIYGIFKNASDLAFYTSSNTKIDLEPVGASNLNLAETYTLWRLCVERNVQFLVKNDESQDLVVKRMEYAFNEQVSASLISNQTFYALQNPSAAQQPSSLSATLSASVSNCTVLGNLPALSSLLVASEANVAKFDGKSIEDAFALRKRVDEVSSGTDSAKDNTKENKGKNSVEDSIVNVLLLKDLRMPSDGMDNSISYAPLADGSGTLITIPVVIDVQAYMNKTDDSVYTALSILRWRAASQALYTLSFIKQTMTKEFIKQNMLTSSSLYLPMLHTVCIDASPYMSHVITLHYPARHDGNTGCGFEDPKESYWLKQRQAYHCQFMLPSDRPLLRLMNGVPFNIQYRPCISNSQTHTSYLSSSASSSASASATYHIINVHLHIPSTGPLSSGVKDGVQYMIRGDYQYHHYMQDKFDDKGWGCAYRTLQTIISWFRCQKYIASYVNIPTHLQVQECLVNDLKDKPAAFVGSREWIGAIELSMVLGQMYGIECKTLFIAQGSEIPSHARRLAQHFEQQGTPVMIGGGQLAYGLLGIDYNESTGQVKFLILDPHYTGGEQPNFIIQKKWCAWQDASLFIKSSFYNFCLPQRPMEI